MLGLTTVGSVATVAYANHLGVPTGREALSRSRGRWVALGLLIVALLGGIVRGAAGVGDDPSTLAGAVTGLAVGVALIVIVERFVGRRRTRRLDDAEEDERNI